MEERRRHLLGVEPRHRHRARRARAQVRAVGAAALIAALWPAAAGAGELEVRARRGVGGVVPLSGVDAVEVELRNQSGGVARGRVWTAAAPIPFEVPVGGRATVALWRPAPTEGERLPAAEVVVELAGERRPVAIPEARLVDRPLILAGVDGAALARLALAAGIAGEPVVVAPEALPTGWPAYDGVVAVVVEQPAGASGSAPAILSATLAGIVATGGRVCRSEGAELDCLTGPVAAEAVARLRVEAPTLAPALRALGASTALLGLGLLALALAARDRRRVLVAALAAVALVWIFGPRRADRGAVAARGFLVADGRAAYVVAAVRHRPPLAGGDVDLGEGLWWLRPIERADGYQPMWRRTWPAGGAYLVQGRLPEGGAPPAWARHLEAVTARPWARP